mgnify:CR=1 FL=1
MDPERIAHFRNRLKKLRAEIQEHLQTSKDSSAAVELDTSIGRLSRMDAMQDQQMALELRRRRENQLLRIQSALERMSLGTYGTCISCKEPIPEPRLELSPDAATCVECSTR